MSRVRIRFRVRVQSIVGPMAFRVRVQSIVVVESAEYNNEFRIYIYIYITMKAQSITMSFAETAGKGEENERRKLDVVFERLEWNIEGEGSTGRYGEASAEGSQ